MSTQRDPIQTNEIFELLDRTGADEAIRFLRSLIHSGELGPGDRLPPERELSAKLGISRLTLRLALKALEASGYIHTRRGAQGGAFVSELADPLDHWAERMRANIHELEGILEFRIAVETRAAALAAQRRTDKDLEAMASAIDHLALVDTRSSFRRADAEFHSAVARASRNTRLEQAIRVARGELFFPTDRLVYEERVKDTERGHRAAFTAIRNQDPLGASAAMESHLKDAWTELRAILRLNGT